MDPQDRVVGGRNAAVQSLLDDLKKHLPGAREVQLNRRLQEELACDLRRLWGAAPEPQRAEILRDFLPYFPRALDAPDPHLTLQKIFELPTEEDVHRALRVDPRDYRYYASEPGEMIYPTTGWLGKYLEYAQWNEVPRAFHFWAGLTILAAAARRNFYLDIGVEYLFPPVYTILSGKKGTKKSVAMRIAGDIISRMNRKLLEEDPSILRAYGVHVFPEDITQAALVQELTRLNTVYAQSDPAAGTVELPGGDPTVGDACGIIFCDELANLFGKDTYAAGQKIPFFTAVAFGGRYSKATKKDQREEIENIGISILGCSAPEWFRKTIHSDALSGGFLDRMNVIYRTPSAVRSIPQTRIPPLDPVRAEELARWLHRLCRPRRRSKVRLELRRDAADYFEHWYQMERAKGIQDADDARMKSLERHSNQILRTSLMLALAEEEIPWVGLDRVEKALEITTYEDQWLAGFWERVTDLPDDAYRMIVRYFMNQNRVLKMPEIKKRFRKTSHFAGPNASETVERHVKHLVETGELQEWGKYYALPFWKRTDFKDGVRVVDSEGEDISDEDD